MYNLLWLFDYIDPPAFSFSDDAPVADMCPQPPSLTPSVHSELWQDLGRAYETEEFINRAVNWLGGAVRVP